MQTSFRQFHYIPLVVGKWDIVKVYMDIDWAIKEQVFFLEKRPLLF